MLIRRLWSPPLPFLVRSLWEDPEADAGDPIADGIAEHMTVSADYVAPLELAGSVANGGVAMVDVSGNGAPDVLSANGGAARHIIQTSSPPTGMSTWVDMSQHFVTEYIAIATALSAKHRCGGIVFKASGLSPGEISLLSHRGTSASPFNASDGDGTGCVLVLDWAPYVGSVPGCNGVPATSGTGGGSFAFDGWGAYTGWLHLQWRTVGAGAAHVRSYLSKIGSAFAGQANHAAPTEFYLETAQNCAADGISAELQIGYAGSHDSGVLGIARVYLGTDDALDVAELEAIHDLFA